MVPPATLQPFPPVVAQALQYLAVRVRGQPLGGPTVLPPEPPSHTYLTAWAEAGAGGWVVRQMKTDQPYAVNNPRIASASAHARPVASFGVRPLVGPVPAVGTPALAELLWRQGLWAGGTSPEALGPLLPEGQVVGAVRLGYGIVARVYRAGAATDSLLWREGDWTVVVRDTPLRTAVALARPVVAYLHVAFLPPYPGLVAVTVGIAGVFTLVDWRVGPRLYHIQDDLAWGDNPVAACSMAVHWQGG